MFDQKTMSSKETVVPPDAAPEQKSVPLLGNAAYVSNGWPTTPKFTIPPLYVRLWNVAADVAFLLFSTAFLLLALIVNHYDQASTEEHPLAMKGLQAASKYGPTVFPILFAAVFGRAMHAILIWRLESGELIGNLDVLAGSTSLTSTLTSQLQLRRINALGIALMLVWALSPVGGQGTIRQMTFGNSSTIETTSFNYTAPSDKLNLTKGLEGEIYVTVADTLFNAAILGTSSVKSSPRDSWGNIKIPRIETLEEKNSTASDKYGWYDTRGKDQEYVSLVGVPMSGIDEGFVDYNFNIDTTYFHLKCSAINKNDYQVPEGSYNTSNIDDSIQWQDDIEGRTATNKTQLTPDDPVPVLFTYRNSPSKTIASCKIESTYVEVEISCQTYLTCGVTRIRRSKKDHYASAHTPFDLNNRHDQNSTFHFFAEKFLNSVGAQPNFGSMLDAYILSPLNPFRVWLGVDTTEFTAEQYSLRLAQLVNSYWACLNNVYTISGGVSSGTAYLDSNPSFKNSTEHSVEGPNFLFQARTWPAKGIRVTVRQVFVVHKEWVAALCIAALALIAASLVSPIMRLFLIKGPDVLMNISSLATRNNPLIPIPASGTYMDASDRSRLLKDARVRFGDVDKNGETGCLAIGALEDRAGLHIERIRKRRLYE